MTPVRRTALVAGVFYLITFISSIPSWFLLEAVLSNPNYIASAGADTQVTWGALLDIITAFAGIGTAVALFSILKRQHEGLALGFVTTRTIEAALIMICVVTELAVVTLRQAATPGDATLLVGVGAGLIAVHDWAFLFGPGLMPVLNALLLGTLLYTSRLVPRLIPAMGLIGAPLLLSSTLGTMFGINHDQSAWTGLATIPIFFWELSVGLWMTFKGFNPSAPILADPDEAVRARGSGTGAAQAAAEAGAA